MKLTCKLCEKKFKVLTQEGLCAFCFKNEKGFWSKEFSGGITNDGKPGGIQQMKFRKTKHRKKKGKKKKRK